jgi:hypothetical protein
MPPAKSLVLLETLTLARPVFFQLVVVDSDLNANPTDVARAEPAHTSPISPKWGNRSAVTTGREERSPRMPT